MYYKFKLNDIGKTTLKMTIENKSEDKVITFIPMQIYRKTQLLKTKGLQHFLGVTYCT